MGLLRFLLAVSVILAHTKPIRGISFVGGPLAVETFFIISGFYITLILNEKYIKVNNSYWLFISNRFLRIYPIYWAVLILTLICIVFLPGYNSPATEGSWYMYQKYGKDLSLSTYAYLLVTHLVVFLQETALYLGIDIKSGNLFFTSNYQLTHPHLYLFELLPQAWSIGLELMFYVLAPFLVKRKWWIILIVISASMLFKIWGFKHGYHHDPWSYRFFPFELMYFLFGSLSYIIYKRFIQKITMPNYIGAAMLVFVALFTITFSTLHEHISHVLPAYLLCIVCCMPVLFKFTKNSKLDRFIGELSYPVYITHILVRNILVTTVSGQYLNITTILGSILLSVCLIKLIGDRVETTRQARVVGQRGINTVPDALSVKL